MRLWILISILFLCFQSKATSSPVVKVTSEKTEISKTKVCTESYNYDLGFNDAKNGKDLATPELKNCSVKIRAKLISSYRNGFKEALEVVPKKSLTPQPVSVVIDSSGDTGYLASLSKCSDFKRESGSCFSSFDGNMRAQCEVCREEKSCFISLAGKARSLCEAYHEKKSCFVSFETTVDREWCEHLKDKKSCEDAFGLNMTDERIRCEHGEIPQDHFFWMN